MSPYDPYVNPYAAYADPFGGVLRGEVLTAASR
jgi:hypothetical protein